MIETKLRTSAVYDRTRDAIGRTSRFVSSCGGTRSGKTFANLQLIYLMAMDDSPAHPTITSVVSETFPHLKRGAIRDFPLALGDAWEESRWAKGSSVYTCPNGSIIEFFSADSPAKVHGPARDRLFLNEVQNIPWEIARQLFIRTRGLVLLDYNPTHEGWVQQQIETRPECVTIHSTYKDNLAFLTDEQIREIEANQHDKNWWRVYGLGELGTLDGLIYPDIELIDDLPDTSGMLETYGLDFGFTNSMTAICHCFIHRGRKEIYLDQRLYRRGVQNHDIADFLKAENIRPGVVTYCDAAEPKSIRELEQYGLNVAKCDKTSMTDRHNPITAQIGFLKGYKLFVTKGSIDLIKELRGYVWATNTNGDRLNVPVKINDHLCDAFRYGCYTPLAQASGQYSLSVIR